MSDKPTIQIDDDWKRQAQEEKRKLAEEAKAKEAKAAAAPPPALSAASSAAGASPTARVRELPAASFASIVQGIVTQALYYLGELGHEGEAPMLNLDMARHQIDTLDVLEKKTKGNLDKEEQSLLDQGAYELRSRFVAVARQFIQ